MEHHSNKETGRKMFSGFFAVVPIAMAVLFLWGLIGLLGYDVSMDIATARILVYGLPVLFLVYWFLFKYYDKNNP